MRNYSGKMGGTLPTKKSPPTKKIVPGLTPDVPGGPGALRRNGIARRAGTGRRAALDEISRQLVEELQRDGRRSYAALAQRVGLSEAAVRQRVRRLLDEGVMQIVAVTDPMTLGFTRQALVGIRADGDLREIAEKLSALPELEYVVICAGSFDLLVELVCEDDEHLLALLNDSVRSIEGVREAETFVYLRLVKQSYAWGTR